MQWAQRSLIHKAFLQVYLERIVELSVVSLCFIEHSVSHSQAPIYCSNSFNVPFSSGSFQHSSSYLNNHFNQWEQYILARMEPISSLSLQLHLLQWYSMQFWPSEEQIPHVKLGITVISIQTLILYSGFKEQCSKLLSPLHDC